MCAPTYYERPESASELATYHAIGVLAGTNMANFAPASCRQPEAAIAGTSGNNAEDSALVTASALILPNLMWDETAVALLNANCTCR